MSLLSFIVETISEEGKKSPWGVHPMRDFVHFAARCRLNRPANCGRISKQRGQWMVKAKPPESGNEAD
jgi:hypothetical protein